MSEQLTFDPPKEPPKGRLIFSLVVPGRLPSWNAMLGMEQWARYQFKKELADIFLLSLRESERACSTTTTPAKSTTLTYSATLASYLMTAQARRASKLRNKKLKLASVKKSESLFTKSKVPF